jgi:hypothetical protein
LAEEKAAGVDKINDTKKAYAPEDSVPGVVRLFSGIVVAGASSVHFR